MVFSFFADGVGSRNTVRGALAIGHAVASCPLKSRKSVRADHARKKSLQDR